jgi:high-affinity nickel permease
MNRIFGGPVLAILFKLAVASIAVGIVLAILGIRPIDLWRDFLATAANIWSMGFEAIEWSIQYLVLGAIVVVPIFIVVRLWTMMTERERKD